MKTYLVTAAAVLAFALADPARAAETGEQTAKAQTKVKVQCLGEDEGCKVIKINKGGEKKVIKLSGDGLLKLDNDLDTATRLKLLDAKISHLKATGPVKTDLAIKRLEAEKLDLSGRPDAEVLARKKEVNALKAKLEDMKLDYEQQVKKLAPEGMAELYLLDLDDAGALLDMSLGLPGMGGKSIIKCIDIDEDED